MTTGTLISAREDKASPYANSEDFRGIFMEGLNGLYQLSLLLTGNQKKAEKCFVSGVEDCVKENRVFREWARSWAKRAIIQNAIREVRPRPNRSNFSSAPSVPFYTQQFSGSGEHFVVDSVLELKDFERFVFVMSVLEHYSQHECALLLGCPISEVREARVRALKSLAGAPPVLSFTPANSQIRDSYVSR